jgi:hypothetical protein
VPERSDKGEGGQRAPPAGTTAKNLPVLAFATERFSAADVLYGTTFVMFGQSPMMPKSTVIDDYVQRIVTRPAFERAQARDNG